MVWIFESSIKGNGLFLFALHQSHSFFDYNLFSRIYPRAMAKCCCAKLSQALVYQTIFEKISELMQMPIMNTLSGKVKQKYSIEYRAWIVSFLQKGIHGPTKIHLSISFTRFFAKPAFIKFVHSPFFLWNK